MKIINVVDFFHPDAGYENNVLSKYMVSFGYEYVILTTDIPDPMGFFPSDNLNSRDADFSERTGVKVIRIHCDRIISGRAIWNYSSFLEVINLQKPDVLFFCGNDTYIAIRYILSSRRNRYPFLADSHMLAMASQNKFAKMFRWFYRTFVTPKIIRKEIPVIRVQDDPYVEKYLGIPLSQSPLISFGTDTRLFHPDSSVKNEFREKLSIPKDAFVFLYTGKLDESKGGKLLAKAFQDTFLVNKPIVLIVVGSSYGTYGEEVESMFESSKNKVIRFGTQKYIDLPRFYQIADASVFPRQCSLSFYDAQGCGLPVISENNQINIDRNSHGNGFCFKADDVDDFRKELERIANFDDDEYRKVSKNALDLILKSYNYEDKAREYEKIFNWVYNNNIGVK